jgi:hypothetical protein
MHYVLEVQTLVLQGYVDSDMAGDKDSKRSTTRYVFTIGGTDSKLDFKNDKRLLHFKQ